MDEVFLLNPADSLSLSEFATNKLANSGIATIRALVRLSIGQAYERLGRSAYRETLRSLKHIHLSFEMTEHEIKSYDPGREGIDFEDPAKEEKGHRRHKQSY